MKIFRGFWVFEYALMVKNENPETLEINIELSKFKKKHPVVTAIIIKKLLKCNQFYI